jgi:hypothetical protein
VDRRSLRITFSSEDICTVIRQVISSTKRIVYHNLYIHVRVLIVVTCFLKCLFVQ